MSKKGKLRNITSEDKVPKGLYNQAMMEKKVPIYNKAGCEVVETNNHNAHIVLGRDRPGHTGSGIGGRGGTNCGMIDLIVGLDNCFTQKPPKEKKTPEQITGDEVGTALQPPFYEASPSTHGDAARLYLTQRGDIDWYFGLDDGSLTPGGTANKSGAVLKADHVRIVGRNHIKIVTGKQKLQGGDFKGERNSTCGSNDYAGKIDLIGGNYTDDVEIAGLSAAGKSLANFFGINKTLQPLVKGENLREFLKEILDLISDLSERVTENSSHIRSIVNTISSHTHVAAGFGSPTSPPLLDTTFKNIKTTLESIKTTAFANVIKQNITLITVNYLEMRGPSYINSRHVNTT